MKVHSRILSTTPTGQEPQTDHVLVVPELFVAILCLTLQTTTAFYLDELMISIFKYVIFEGRKFRRLPQINRV